jgi:hypothetical protein
VQKSAEKALSFLKKDHLLDSEYVYMLDVVEEEEMMMRNRLPQHFPKGLMEDAYLLDYIGSAEIAWKYEAAIAVVKFYAANEYVILGGDVYEIRNEHIRPTLDNWYFSSKNPFSQEDLSLSRDKAILYIENYYLKNGDDYGYTLVVRSLKQ